MKKYTERGLTKEQVEQFSKEDLQKELADAVQTFNYQVNSMSTTNGCPKKELATLISND